MTKKTTQFRNLLAATNVEYLVEAHNALSARIVEESGHAGIWASGLTLSATMGVRDNNEVSWTQVLEVLEFMSDATDIPVMLDGDTGYGNFNNVRRLIKKLEQRKIAAVCLEDKLFPKTNSFIDGGRQALADIDEFAGKIKAAKDTQEDDDFSVVARTEAFIVGWGLDEALKRAEAYHAAGADAVLVHSKKTTAEEIIAFVGRWDRRCPIVVVPTTYYSTPTEVFEEAGVSLVIWANHLLRSSIASMQRTARQLQEQRTALSVEDHLATVPEIFRLQGADELKEAEKRYLPEIHNGHRAVVLAASRGDALGRLTQDKPKSMIPIQGEPLLATLVRYHHEAGIQNVYVVVGYKPEAVTVTGIKKIYNPDYADTKELYSLYQARHVLNGPAVVSFGDVIFKRYILLNLLSETGDIVIVADGEMSRHRRSDSYRDLLHCTKARSNAYLDEPVYLERIDPYLDRQEAHGEWIGLMRLSANGAVAVCDALEALQLRDDFAELRMKDLFDHLLRDRHRIRVVYVRGHWLDVDDLEVLTDAVEF